MSYSHTQHNTPGHPIPPPGVLFRVIFPVFLFRVIRTYDVQPETGFRCGDTAADLTFDQHVQRGFNNVIKSQYISTTRSLCTAIKWITSENNNFGTTHAFTIISFQALNRDIEGYDLSGDCLPILNGDCWANGISSKHKEVLLTPYVNKEAIVRIVSKIDLEDCRSWPAKVSFVQGLLMSARDYCGQQLELDNAAELASLRCDYCTEQGHDINRGDRCEQLEHDNAVDELASLRCAYCREQWHDINRGDRCEQFELDSALDELASLRCAYCGEQWHDINQGDCCEQFELDNAEEEPLSLRCDYCDEQGHDINRDDRCEQLELDNLVNEVASLRCDYCGEQWHDASRGDHCQELELDSMVVNYETLVVSQIH